MATFIKDPSAVLDYVFDWAGLTNGSPGARSDWLLAGETIGAHVITAEAGITAAPSALTDGATSVTVWLSGGTHGSSYTVTCRIVTTGGRTDERSITIRVGDR